MFEDEPALAWIAMPYRAPVVADDGTHIGSAESLLGDEKEDIFHGIVVKRSGKAMEIPAVRIKRITAKGVDTDLSAGDVEGLQPYVAERWFHIGWGGVFRKHPKWDNTSNP
jgi:hypothetical protein